MARSYREPWARDKERNRGCPKGKRCANHVVRARNRIDVGLARALLSSDGDSFDALYAAIDNRPRRPAAYKLDYQSWDISDWRWYEFRRSRDGTVNPWHYKLRRK